MNKDGRSALHVAAKQGNLEVVGQLLKAQANPFAADKVGRGLAQATQGQQLVASQIVHIMPLVASRRLQHSRILAASALHSFVDSEVTRCFWTPAQGLCIDVACIPSAHAILQLRSACVTWLQTGATPADLAEAQGHTEVAALIRRTTVPSAPSLPTATRRQATEHTQQAPHQVPSSSSQNAASADVRQTLLQRGTDPQSASGSFDSHASQPSAPSRGFVSYPTVYSGDAHRAAEGAATSTDRVEPVDATSSSSVIWQASTAVLGTVKVSLLLCCTWLCKPGCLYDTRDSPFAVAVAYSAADAVLVLLHIQ